MIYVDNPYNFPVGDTACKALWEHPTSREHACHAGYIEKTIVHEVDCGLVWKDAWYKDSMKLRKKKGRFQIRIRLKKLKAQAAAACVNTYQIKLIPHILRRGDNDALTIQPFPTMTKALAAVVELVT